MPSVRRNDIVPNPRVGAYYAIGAALALVLAVRGWPWAWIVLWPALSLAIVAAGYFGVGPSMYRKRSGFLPTSTQLLLAPTLLGQHLSLRYYRRQCRPWDEVAPGVLIGRSLDDREAVELVDHGVTAVLDLTVEFSEAAPLRRIIYRNVQILDLTAPTVSQLREAVNFITDQIAGGGTVYVHCKIGYSRSATIVGAYLMASGLCNTVEEAISRLRAARPPIVIRPEAIAALKSFPK